MKNRKISMLISAVLIVGIMLTGCGGGNEQPVPQQSANNQPDGYLEIRGSDTMVNFGQALAEQYMDQVNENASISVTGGGSGTGIAAIINNDVDIAQSSRSIKNEEVESAKQNNVEVFEFIVGQDGVALVIHEDNSVDQLTMAQLKDILTGKITHWSELGWAEGGEINVYSRQSNSGTYAFVNETIMDGEDWAPKTMFMPGSSAIAEGLRADKNGIGYFGAGYVKDGIKAISVAATAGSEYYTPMDKANVDNGLYPVARPLLFYTNGAPEGLLLHYLEWVLSPAGTEIIEELGFYGPNVNQLNANDQVFKNAGIK